LLPVSAKVKAIRGMRDILPSESGAWQRLEAVIADVLDAYGYREIRLPLLEKTELFARSIGEVTDIVEKEMYTFADRNDDSLTLRPEGTAGCVRACIEHGLLHNQVQRLWYRGPMFPYGMDGPDIDAEVILVGHRLWQRLGLEVELQLNSLGDSDERAAYRERLVDYFQASLEDLDEDSRRRLESNPLRILDSKNPDMQPLLAAAPALLEHLGPESRAHFDGLCARLDAAGVDYVINPRLVRGLDYYGRSVFEWVTDRLGAQGTVCAGGRYDALVEQLGGKPTPAVGFAMGLERLVELLTTDEVDDSGGAPAQVYVVVGNEALAVEAMALSERLRDDITGLRLSLHCGGGSLKSQFKRADRSGAEFALVLGEEEWARGEAAIKPLRGGGEQTNVAIDQLTARLRSMLDLRP
jgi:histidyl-tRNA synthetase